VREGEGSIGNGRKEERLRIEKQAEVLKIVRRA
jgi:hypothetical protein